MNALSSEQENTEHNSINNQNYTQILRNSAILAGGGGGNYQTATEIFQNQITTQIPVRDIEEFEPDVNLATFFSLGPVRDDNSVDIETVRNSVNTFEERYGEISGIVLGEVGPEVISSGCLAAQELDVPIVNADVAGMRAVPTVQTEIVENIDEIERLPAVATSLTGETRFIEGERLESALRGLSNFTWFITGYLNNASSYQDAPRGWFENCLNLTDDSINNLATGEVRNWRSNEVNGHTLGHVEVVNQRYSYDVYFLNENALVLQDGQVVASMPDSITIQTTDGTPLYNGDPPRIGRRVRIVVYNQEEHWGEDRNLLTPESIGFSSREGQISFQGTPINQII